MQHLPPRSMSVSRTVEDITETCRGMSANDDDVPLDRGVEGLGLSLARVCVAAADLISSSNEDALPVGKN